MIFLCRIDLILIYFKQQIHSVLKHCKTEISMKYDNETYDSCTNILCEEFPDEAN
jgi:hypothetical protein